MGGDADLGGDGLGGRPRVAGHQPDLDARRGQLADGGGGLGLDRIADGEEPGGAAVDGHEADGAVGATGGRRPPSSGPRSTPAREQPAVADEDRTGDARRRARPSPGRRRRRPPRSRRAGRTRARRAAPGRRRRRRAGARCRSRALAARSRTSRGRPAGRRHDLGHGRPAEGQRAGLVEDHGVDLVGDLEGLAAADEDAGLGAASGPDHDRRRRGQPEGARTGDDDDAR